MNQRVKRAIAAAMSLTMVATATPVSPLYNAIQNAVSSAMMQANAGTIEDFKPRVLSVSLYDDVDNVQSIEMLYDWPFSTKPESPVYHCVVLTDRKISYTGQLVDTYKQNDTDINNNFKRIMWINNEDGSTYSDTTDPILSITESREVTSIMNDVETIFNFDKGVLSADDENKELYIYLWTKNTTGYWYPDFQFATLKVDDGKIYYGQSENSPTNLLQFSIQKAALSQSTFYYLKGETNKPAVMYRGKQLIEGTDYTVTGTSSAEDIGEYSMTINGIGAYTGSKTFTWKVSVNEINTIEDLEALAASVNAGRTFEGETIVLNADIAEAFTTPIGTKEHPFKGTFDGNGKTIKLNINQTTNYAGLFGYVEGATIRNVTVEGSVTGTTYVGSICGYADSTNVYNCTNNAAVTGSLDNVGGICGYVLNSSNVYNCTNNATVTGEKTAVGGICAGANKSNVYNCTNNATVTGSSNNVGGICAATGQSNVYNCTNNAAVTSITGGNAGGICGNVLNISNVYNCINNAAVKGSSNNVGGIYGKKTDNDTVDKCYLLDANDKFDTVDGVTEINAEQLAGTAPLDAASGITLIKKLNNDVMNYNNATPAPAIPFMYWKNDAALGHPVLTDKTPLENAGLTLAENSVIYSNSDFKPTVKLGNDTITSGTDFIIKYQKKDSTGEYQDVTEFKDAGNYRVVVTATDDNDKYFDSFELEYNILTKADFTNINVEKFTNSTITFVEKIASLIYGQEYTFTSDYKLHFSDGVNVEVDTNQYKIKSTGNTFGVKYDISDTAAFEVIADNIISGAAPSVSLNIPYSDEDILVSGNANYTVEFLDGNNKADLTKAGTYTVKVTATDANTAYFGTATGEIKVLAKGNFSNVTDHNIKVDGAELPDNKIFGFEANKAYVITSDAELKFDGFKGNVQGDLNNSYKTGYKYIITPSNEDTEFNASYTPKYSYTNDKDQIKYQCINNKNDTDVKTFATLIMTDGKDEIENKTIEYGTNYDFAITLDNEEITPQKISFMKYDSEDVKQPCGKPENVGKYFVQADEKFGDATYPLSFDFVIKVKDIAAEDVAKSVTDVTYDGEKHTPSATVTYKGKTLLEGEDYTVNITDKINAGTYDVIITGIGNYTGSTTLEWNINKADMTDQDVTKSVKDITYDGEKHTPSATVKYKGKTLLEGEDYTVNIKDKINADTADTYEVIITGIGNYKGSTTLEWNIKKADMTDFKFKNSAPYVKTYDAEAVDVSTKDMSTDADFGIENYPVGTTFEYSYSVKDASGTLTPIQGNPVDAGNYIVSIMPVNPNYNCYSITKDITIKKAEVTLTPESKSVTYGKAMNAGLAIKYEIKNETAIPDADKSLFSDNAVSQFLFAENYDAKKGVVNSYNILLDTASLETYDKNKDNLADYRNFAVSTESGKQITVNPISLTDKAIEIVFIDDGKKGEYEYTGNYYSLYGKINVIYKENVWGENELKEITDFVLRGNVQKYAMGDYLVQVDALSIDSPTLTGRKAVAWSIGMNKTVDFVSNSNITYGEELVCDIMPKLIDKDVNVVYNYYNADTDEKLAAAPTDAGKYYVIADVTNKSGETATYKDTFEISKKKLYFEAIDYEITYKDDLPNIADVVKFYSDSEGEESVTLTDEEIAELIDFSDEFKQTTFNVGEYNYGFKSGSGHKNYEWNSVYITNSDGKLKVNPKQITEDMFVFADKAFVLDPNIGVATIKYELNDITEDDYIAFEDVTAYAPGKYTVEFRGKGNYTGNVRVNWNVAAKCSYSHSITMNNNMTLNYYISHSDIQKFENVRLEVTNTATGVKKELKGELKIWDQSYGYEYRFEYTGIAAKEIGANIEAVLVAEKDGVEYHFNEDVYSIKNYCYIQLAKPTNTEKDQLLKTMLVDLLNYGSEAQKYFKYDTDNLANAALTAEQKAWGTSETPDVKSCEETIKLAGATASISGKSLVFGNSVDLKFYMNLQNVKNTDNVKLRISYTNSHNKPVTKYFDFDDFGFSHDEKYGDEYTISYNGLNAADFSVPINVTIMDGEKEISDTIVYSIESYAKKFIGKNEISDVLIEMMKYSKSADAYLNK